MPEWLKRLTKSDIRNSISIIVVLGSFALLYIMLIKPVPPANKDIVLTSIGFVLGGALSGVVGYYFGSSKPEHKRED
jgi:hypothetical protein